MAGLIGQVALEFNAGAVPKWVDEPIQRDLSAGVRVWDCLFAACDETAGIERLRLTGGKWTGHRHFDIGAILGELPGDDKDEMDIEALSVCDGWLWLTGSQAFKRKKPRAGDDPKEALDRLRSRVFEPKRQFLGRLPLANHGDGLEPVKRDRDRKAAYVKFDKEGRLRDWLRGDPWIGRFLKLPSKENGLDVEALAVDDRRIWLGLRGPVISEYSVVIEMKMRVASDGHLKAARIDGNRRYRLHFLPTGGDGIRDLVIDGEDLIVLVGTTGANDGRSAVYRWLGVLRRQEAGIVSPGDLPLLVDLGYRGRRDNPEGLVRWDGGRWLLIHDSPAEWRLDLRSGSISADIWDLGTQPPPSEESRLARGGEP